MNADIIIIGSGLAGYSLAREIRRIDQQKSILMITSDDGRYYSKPMLSTGFTKNKSADELAMKSTEQMAEELAITIYAHTEVTHIDRATKTLSLSGANPSARYQQLVLATGAAPIHIPLPDALTEYTLAINDLQDYDRFRQRLGERKNVTIIGSGLVGTEYANDLLGAGVNVHVVALDDGPLQLLLPPPLSQAVKTALANKGINWHFNTTINDAVLNPPQPSGDHTTPLTITLADGTSHQADLVLSAVGLRPRTALAKQAGLTVERGIVVDETLTTSDKDIFAFGDCSQINGLVLMYVIPLTFSAKALAKTLCGEPSKVQIPAAPVIVKTPDCPVVSCPAPTNSQGEWLYEGEGADMKAIFISPTETMLGFALTGNKVMERMKLAKQLPALI